MATIAKSLVPGGSSAGSKSVGGRWEERFKRMTKGVALTRSPTARGYLAKSSWGILWAEAGLDAKEKEEARSRWSGEDGEVWMASRRQRAEEGHGRKRWGDESVGEMSVPRTKLWIGPVESRVCVEKLMLPGDGRREGSSPGLAADGGLARAARGGQVP